MHWRKRPWLDEAVQRLQQQNIMVGTPEHYRGHWQERFGNAHSIHIEVGCGRGRFITQMALMRPEINFIAIDVVPDLICYVGEKVIDQGITNVLCTALDSEQLGWVFAPGEVECIYLNFSDPWPKRRHAKRRLTHERFLQIYAQLLSPGGAICFKTDNEVLFEYSLNSFSAQGYHLQNICFDLHGRGYDEHNVMTEYEQKFSARGQRIFRCEAIVANR